MRGAIKKRVGGWNIVMRSDWQIRGCKNGVVWNRKDDKIGSKQELFDLKQQNAQRTTRSRTTTRKSTTTTTTTTTATTKNNNGDSSVAHSWTSVRHVKDSVVFVSKPNQNLYAQQYQRLKCRLVTYGSLYYSWPGPKVCVLEKKVSLVR